MLPLESVRAQRKPAMPPLGQLERAQRFLMMLGAAHREHATVDLPDEEHAGVDGPPDRTYNTFNQAIVSNTTKEDS